MSWLLSCVREYLGQRGRNAWLLLGIQPDKDIMGTSTHSLTFLSEVCVLQSDFQATRSSFASLTTSGNVYTFFGYHR